MKKPDWDWFKKLKVVHQVYFQETILDLHSRVCILEGRLEDVEASENVLYTLLDEGGDPPLLRDGRSGPVGDGLVERVEAAIFQLGKTGPPLSPREQSRAAIGAVANWLDEESRKNIAVGARGIGGGQQSAAMILRTQLKKGVES